MRIKQYTKEQVFARPKMVKTLRTLTNSGPPHDSFVESGMRWWLADAGYDREAVVFIAWKMATIIGWCYANEGYHGHWQISCYVHHSHRQKGIGTKLTKKAKAHVEGLGKKLTFATWEGCLGYNMYSKQVGLEYQTHKFH